MVLASCAANSTIASVPMLESPRLDKYSAGAMFFDWTKDGVDEDEETPVQLQTDSDTFAAEMEAKGVGTDRPVVVSCPSQSFHPILTCTSPVCDDAFVRRCCIAAEHALQTTATFACVLGECITTWSPRNLVLSHLDCTWLYFHPWAMAIPMFALHNLML